jgi:hypothetical protein
LKLGWPERYRGRLGGWHIGVGSVARPLADDMTDLITNTASYQRAFIQDVIPEDFLTYEPPVGPRWAWGIGRVRLGPDALVLEELW